MYLAIVRTANGPLDTNGYNIQEIGLATGLLKLGYNVDIYSTFKDITDEKIIVTLKDFRIKLIPIKGFALKQVTYYQGLTKFILSQNYQVLQIHDDSQLMGPFIAAQAKKHGLKTVLYQGMYTNYSGLGKIYQTLFDWFLKRKLQKNIDVIFAKTTKAKEYLENKGFTDITILPVGLDFKKQNPYIDQAQLDSFTTKFETTFLYIGKLEPRRDLTFVINVFRELIHSKNKNLGFVIVGKGPDEFKLRELVSTYNLKDRVLFIEQIANNEIAHVYKSCDLFILPSNYEIYGMVVLEALYYGIPVVSTKTAGPLDILKEDYLGCLLDFNTQTWLTSLTALVASNLLTEEYALQRKQYVVNNYSWDIIAKSYIKEL
ncbi:glycosyltransferase family 4 protein [Leeuwenhoekiella sp. NPDC079379]|uniref:glycosyltransferase family 4 protein n=1 Tax=Leeuwenhoekiella sp. NPDC079379 TaxID=3364122 RepID=UPI0037C62F1C